MFFGVYLQFLSIKASKHIAPLDILAQLIRDIDEVVDIPRAI
jgi:hypothetical protein